MGDEETKLGALNRACNARDCVCGRGEAADFFVGLEGGCAFEAPVELPLSSAPSAAPAVAHTVAPPEPSTRPSAQARPQQLSCFAWGIVIKAESSVVGAARTASFQLPNSVANLVSQVTLFFPACRERLASPVSQGFELGVADDMVFGRVDSKRTGGSVGLLSGGLIDRTAYYEHAMILALVPFMECNKDLF